jgi:hypothetical protein
MSLFKSGHLTSSMQAAVRRSVVLSWNRGFASTPGLVDCSKVVAKRDAHGGVGAFAAVDLKKGDLIERGIVRVLPVNGHDSPYVFTWKRGDETVYATGSGCSVLYNTSLDGSENTEMERFYAEDRFAIFAAKDIKIGEELTHLYHGIDWRACFSELDDERKALQSKRAKATPKQIPDPDESLVDSSKVYVRDHDTYQGVGAYAAVPIKEGELVEKGIMRRLPVSGHDSNILFTWAEDGSKTASGSGCIIFYNAGLKGTANCIIKRFYDEDRFEVYAAHDIAQNEELTHLYRGLEWRQCFRDLHEIHMS